MSNPVLPTLIRVLSTGHTGTKFIAAVFKDQGYESHHEGIYKGEPTSALFEYLKMLGDTWSRDREAYYTIESDFPQPFLGSIQKMMGAAPEAAARRESIPLLGKVFGRSGLDAGTSTHSQVVIDCDNRITLATPLIYRAFEQAGIAVKHLILYRNPLKTIHAIYKVEAPDYRNRPSSFNIGEGVIRAANVWAKIYELAYDQMQQLGEGNFEFLNLERFTWEIADTKRIFGFLDLDFDEDKYVAFRVRTLNRPYRSWKYQSDRNSDLFHDPQFVFTEDQIAAIIEVISYILELFKIDANQIVEEYISFHTEEKPQLRFS